MIGNRSAANVTRALAIAAAASLGSASSGSVSVEKGLLGIRILQSYRTVLRKYGQPAGVYPAGSVVNMDMVVDSTGALTGGVRGPGQGGGTGPALAAGGGGAPGGAGMMGRMGGAGMMGRMGGSGMSSMMMQQQMMGGGPGGMVSAGGKMAAIAGNAAGTRMGMPGTGTPAASATGGGSFAQSGGFIWVYFVPKRELAYEFFFNHDGRVEGVLERGRSGGSPTSHGTSLGSSVRSIYPSYGWPDGIEQQGPGLSLNYNERYHTYFSVLNNRVTGIAVFLRESQRVKFFDQGMGTGGFNTGGGLARGGMPGGGPPGFAGGAGGSLRGGKAMGAGD